MTIQICEEEAWSSSCVDTISVLQSKADVSYVDEHASSSSSSSSSECIETVGCETSVWFSDGNPSNDDEEEEVEHPLVFRRGDKKRCVTVSFPPPIPQYRSTYLRSIRNDGRLVMQMVNRPKPAPRFRSARQGGRLILHLITDNHQEEGNMCIESPKSTSIAENRAISQTSKAASESESERESESESEEVFPVSPCYDRKKDENVEDKCTDAWWLRQNVEQSNVKSENRDPQELHQGFAEDGVRAYEKALPMEFVCDHNGLIRQGSTQTEEEYSVCVRTFWDTWRKNAIDSSCAHTLRLNRDLPSSCFVAASF